MKRNTPRDLQERSLFWLFRKRLFHETRKYTAGIILTAGVTALFIAMLVVGSSFMSASYRAMGLKGPRIFDIKYPTAGIDITLEMPRNINITCGVSDYYTVEGVRLYYSIDFMKTSIPLDGVMFVTNLSGQFYRFTINLGETPEPKTYLFFIWANNSAGYFTHEDNGRSFFSVRVQEPASGSGVNFQDPALLQAIQRVQIGIYNTTTTRDPRPAATIWINETSTAWIAINGVESAHRVGARYYIFTPEANLTVGSPNNITFFVQQDKLYKKTVFITRLDTPLNLTSIRPANGSTVYNTLRWVNFTVNDYIKANVSLTGTFNKTWAIANYYKYFSLPLEFNKTFGNYSIAINASDHYGSATMFTANFTFQKSPDPYIYIFSPNNMSSIVNLTISINASFSELCNVSVENLNVTGSAVSFSNISAGVLDGVSMARGWNYINITATADGRSNSTTLRVYQQPYIIHKFDFNPFAIPGGQLFVDLNFSTNYTVPQPSGLLWYIFDYTGPYTQIPFSIVNGTTRYGVSWGILRATVNIPLYAEHLLFNFTVFFGPENKHYDQNGQDYHVPIAYLYQDLQGPVIRELRIGPKTNFYGTTTITSNDKTKVRVNLFDVTGVKNASILYSLNSTFATNATLNFTYEGGASNGNGYWNVVLPSQINGSHVYCRIMMFDVLNNTDYYNVQYTVNDALNGRLDRVIPGLLDPIYEKAITGAISTLLVIMVLIIVVFIIIFIAINDQNVKREMYREEDRIFILKHVCKLDPPAISKYYYMEQLMQDSIGYGIGALLGFLVLGPVFVSILKITLVAWTFDFQNLFYFSFITLESWVVLLLVLFVLCALLLKLVQVDKYVTKMAY